MMSDWRTTQTEETHFDLKLGSGCLWAST